MVAIDIALIVSSLLYVAPYVQLYSLESLIHGVSGLFQKREAKNKAKAVLNTTLTDIKKKYRKDNEIKKSLERLEKDWKKLKIDSKKIIKSKPKERAELLKKEILTLIEKYKPLSHIKNEIYEGLERTFGEIFKELAKSSPEFFQRETINKLYELESDSEKVKADLESLLVLCKEFGLSYKNVETALDNIKLKLKKLEEDHNAIKYMIHDLNENKLEKLGMQMTQRDEHTVRVIKETFQEGFSDLSKLLEGKKEMEEMAKIVKTRKIGLVVDLINSCKKELDVLGINALGPLHQTRRKMLEILNMGGTIRILLLDPNSPTFSEREDFELDKVGRLRAEWNASLKIIEEILKNLEAGQLHVRIHEEKPGFSMIIVDNKCLHYNPYSEEKGTAGIYSPLEIWYNKGGEEDRFHELKQMFDTLWENAIVPSFK